MIENLFSSKILFEVLAFVFENENKNISTSEIIKATGKNQVNVMRSLEKLAEWQFLSKEKQGVQNFYKLNKENPYFNILKSLFEINNRQNKKYLLINEEGNLSFLSIHYVVRGFVDEECVKYGVMNQVPDFLSYLKNNYGRFYVEAEKWEKCEKESLAKLLTDASFVEKIIYKKSTEKGIRALQLFKEIRSAGFKPNQARAIDLLEEFEKIIRTQISFNYIAVLDLRDGLYSNYLKDYLTKKLKGTDHNVNLIMQKLLNPDKLTYTQLLRIELLKLAIDFKNKDDFPEHELKQIASDWEWLNFGYRGPALSYEYFEQIYKELSYKDLNLLNDELDHLLVYEKIIRKEKNVLFDKIKIDSKHQSFINALSLLSYLKVYRKDTSFLLFYLTYKILDEYNTEIKPDNLHYITLEEAKKLIMGKLKINKAQLSSRERCMSYLTKEEKMFLGKEADEFVEVSIEQPLASESARELKLLEGMAACLGKTGDWIYGEVKIINTPDDMKNMREGDILLSVATTPDILPAMKKAAAIVTDHGGITCHAAIVSRELNIPCLIGTKYATKVFKNGDKVVMCPRHGYIKFQ